MKTLKIGDIVLCESCRGFATGGPEPITNITTKYDETTGEEYSVIHLGDMEFDGRTGQPLNDNSVYYIKLKN